VDERVYRPDEHDERGLGGVLGSGRRFGRGLRVAARVPVGQERGMRGVLAGGAITRNAS